MGIPFKRIAQIQSAAHGLAFSYKLLLYPANILLHIDHVPNCVAIPYSRQCRDLFANDRELFERCLASNDAYTDYLAPKEQYIIYYNDGFVPPWQQARMRWTLAHELGHVLLGHHILHPACHLGQDALPEDTLRLLDQEADVFAAELLAPLPLLFAMEEYERYLPADSIARHFGLTRTAALVRREQLDRKKVYLDRYRIRPEADMPYYRRFAELMQPLMYKHTPVML